MKSNLFAAIMFLFLACSFNGLAQVFKNNDLTITKLEANMWVVETSDSTTMYIIEGTKKAMLIDTGTRCKNLDEVIQKITTKPLEVVLTHAHQDHAGNINYFKEIWLHPFDKELLQPYKGTIHYLKDGQIFDLGGTQLEVVHTPAHTPGSIILLDRKTGNCYSGDSFGSGQVWLQLQPSAPIKTYINSCKIMEKLMDNGIKNVYCGHYPYVKKAYDKSYITAMRELAEAIDNGTVKDAKPFSKNFSSGGSKAMIATKGSANIVYNPAYIK